MRDGGPRPRRPRPGALLGASCLGALLLAGPASGQADRADPTGIWNLQMRSLAERAVGGVQHELLRVREVDGELRAEITAPNDRFLPVQEFRYGDGRMAVRFGVYEYTLEIDGDRVTGRMTSPVDTLEVTGARQESRLYGGDEPEEWVTTRTGVLGHRTEGAPPEDEPDPAAWVRSRVGSVRDLALIVRGNVVTFTNPASFEDLLMAHAGRRVSVRARWVGEQLRIESIEPDPEEER